VERGYIKLYRRITDNKLWKEKPFTKGQAWVDMLILTNYQADTLFVRGIEIEIKRGQLGRSEVKLAERWGWSRGKIRRYFDFLKKEGNIEQQTKHQKGIVTSVITILNYEDYNGNDTVNDTPSGTPNGQHKNTKQYTKKKDKKVKKEKKETDKSAWVLPDDIIKDLNAEQGIKFMTTWQGFVDMRKKIKFPLTDYAKQLAFDKLVKLKEAGDDPIKVLEESILNSWKGLFPLKSDKGQANDLSIAEEAARLE